MARSAQLASPASAAGHRCNVAGLMCIIGGIVAMPRNLPRRSGHLIWLVFVRPSCSRTR
jgi:hypothetical protein